MAIASPNQNDGKNQGFRVNPEINAKLEAFMKAEPDLVNYVKDLPREQLERKYLLRKMQDQDQRQSYDTKVKNWLNRPEQTDLLNSFKATINPNIKPATQERVLVSQAKNYIRNSGIKLN